MILKQCFFRMLLAACCIATVYGTAEAGKPRVIATTDGEIDDRCSMVRFLLYSDVWDIEGIIHSSSKFHWRGHNWAGETWIKEDIDRYATFYDNLRKNSPDYPTPNMLKNLVYVGNVDNVGDMSKDTPGSDRIVEVLLDDEPGPVYLQAWGGTNTIARALWKIQHEHPLEMKKVSRKAVIYIILDQDKTFRDYIQSNWPDLEVLGSFKQFRAIAYKWPQLIPKDLQSFFNASWMKKHIIEGHGPLCSRYEVYEKANKRKVEKGAFRSEGDSPSFMYEIEVGLRSMENPTYGGWGGRFVREEGTKNVWKGAEDDGDIYKPIWRWAEAFQNDWAARADWCVKPYKEANHPPVVTLRNNLDLKARPGDKINMTATGTDPDGDELTYKWWQYVDAGSYKGNVNIKNSDKPAASLTVPKNADQGDTIHVICEVTDTGMPPLTRYQRVIVEVAK